MQEHAHVSGAESSEDPCPPGPPDASHVDVAGLALPPVRDVVRGDQWTVLVLAGELDLYSSVAVSDAIQRERDRGARRLVLDVRDVSFLDSTAIRTLLVARSQLRESGGEVALVAPTRDVRRTLDVSGVSRLLTIHDETPGGSWATSSNP